MSTNGSDRPRRRFGLKRRLWFVVLAVVLLWVIELVDWLGFYGDLERFGIVPRELRGLRGIPLAPFLHGDPRELATDTVPLVVLGALVALRGTAAWIAVTVFVTLVSGLATWALARSGLHVGASGLVFGYFGFLLTAAVVERSLTSLLAAAVTILFYGSLLWRVLPTQPHVFWEAHLFGFAAGILAGRFGPVRAQRRERARAAAEAR